MSQKKILVVDDDAVVVKSLSMKLESKGFQVIVAGDPSDAVGTARTEMPDLIILDINFPPDVASGGLVPWDGFRIMGWLQRVIEGKNIPMIIVTGGDPAKYKERALESGALAFFRKPVEPEALLQVINKALGETSYRPEPASAK